MGLRVKVCTCEKNDVGLFDKKSLFIAGIVFNIAFLTAFVASIVLYIRGVDKNWLIFTTVGLLSIPLEFFSNKSKWRAKGHSEVCSTRYAKFRLVYLTLRR
jgi:hypothetical protein